MSGAGNTIQECLVEEYGDHLVFADGFDGAIVGVTWDGLQVVYDTRTMVRICMEDQGMGSEEEALEYLEFNVFQAHVGESTPIYIDQVRVDGSILPDSPGSGRSGNPLEREV